MFSFPNYLHSLYTYHMSAECSTKNVIISIFKQKELEIRVILGGNADIL
ncbi:hypothetical protein B4168_3234 [Anoxybacillus flavithermus]|nr:hypothetical protein B4168_3234 [Anoxybacillus flavithermus]OAO88439.1 hypothetical protein GT23_0407 [Parageobacillus thermoglucosidasius]